MLVFIPFLLFGWLFGLILGTVLYFHFRKAGRTQDKGDNK